MRRADIFPDPHGNEYEPETADEKAERMRRLDKIYAEDHRRWFEALTGRPSNLTKVLQ